MFSEYSRNFGIYYDNLSTYYVICVCMSVLAITLSWFYHYRNVNNDINNLQHLNSSESLEERNEMESVLASYKPAGQKALEEMTNYLTEDQQMEEKQAEKQQLAAILELLKQQEEKFQVASMEELEGQLRLYR